MTKIAVIAPERFSSQACRIAEAVSGEFIPLRRGVFEQAFLAYPRLIAVMSAGIAVRKIAPLLKGKWRDPAVVVVSPDLRFAIPLIGGHHGANDLARELETLGIHPVITTASEALGKVSVERIAAINNCGIVNPESTSLVNTAILDDDVPVCTVQGPGIVIAGKGVAILLRDGQYFVGIGCRRGVTENEVKSAICQALSEARIQPSQVLAYATTIKKRKESGLITAIEELGGNLVFLPDSDLNVQVTGSPSRASDLIGLKGVAEPAALALAKRKELVLSKRVIGSVTIAIGR